MPKREYETYRKEQQRFADGLLKLAEEQGVEVEQRRIPFSNNDVPEFLKYLDRVEQRARRTIMKDRKHITY